jgi:type IX secretion system PorP/SprF family membrane protein
MCKEMMKKFLLFMSLLATYGLVSAQQDPQFTVGQYQGLAYQNPAVVGSNDAICATLIGRLQWVGFGGEPSTFLFSAESPFELLNKSHGAGLTIMSDKLGQETTLIVKGSYAYRMNLGDGILSAGLSLGYISKSIGNDWDAFDGTDGDVAIPTNGASEGGLDMDFGLFYKIPNKLSIGLSSTHLNASKFSSQLDDKINTGDSRYFNYQIDRTYYLNAQYELPIGQSGSWILKPGVFVKSDLVSTSFQVGGIMEYEEQFWGGLDYRFQDAVALMLGANFQMNGENMAGGTLKVGYSYDFSTSNIRNFSSGSHELFVRYCFAVSPKPKHEEHRDVRHL